MHRVELGVLVLVGSTQYLVLGTHDWIHMVELGVLGIQYLVHMIGSIKFNL